LEFDAGPIPESFIYLGLVGILGGVIVITFMVLMITRYKRCPDNRILVVYGKTGLQNPRCFHGGARFILPLLEDYAWLRLEPMQIEIPWRESLKAAAIVPGVFTVAIGTTPELMQNAAIRLLGLSNTEIRKQAENIITNQLRQLIASLEDEHINGDDDKFLENIHQSLEPELRKIGLVLINPACRQP
jgi:flotillin